MIAVIFEVQIQAGKQQQYLDIASELKPILETMDGFISVERFQSLSDNSKLLSLSFFRDEDAIETWRSLEKHRSAQFRGRSAVFANYRLRVAGVIRDYGMHEREQAPIDSLKVHD